MNKPSSTITAAFLAGTGTALAIEIAKQFGVDINASLSSAAIVFVSTGVGYWKKENVLKG